MNVAMRFLGFSSFVVLRDFASNQLTYSLTHSPTHKVSGGPGGSRPKFAPYLLNIGITPLAHPANLSNHSKLNRSARLSRIVWHPTIEVEPPHPFFFNDLNEVRRERLDQPDPDRPARPIA